MYLFLSCSHLHSSAEGLGSREACRAGQAVVAGLGVDAAVDSIVCVAGVGHDAALVDVFADDAVAGEAEGTLAALERAVGEAGALGAGEARVGETTICRTRKK